MDLIYIGRYCTDEIPGGPEKVAKRIFGNYTKTNKSLFVEYFFDGKKYGVLKKLFGKEITCNVNGSDVCRLGIFPLFLMLLKIIPKIIHLITFERFAVAVFLYKILFRTKVIYNLHGIVVHENKYYRKSSKFGNLKDRVTEKIILNKSDILLLLSKESGKLLKSCYNTYGNKLIFIKNGIDGCFYETGIKKADTGNDTLKTVFIADTCRKEKGFSFLKDTLETIKINLDLYIIGNDIHEKVFIKNDFVKVYRIEKMKPDELSEFLKDKDVFISSSVYEPFGMTTVECMAAGVIPVVTKETGASEMVTDGINGFTYSYGDKERLKSILIELYNKPELREKIFGETMKIYNDLNWDKINVSYINIYNSIR